MIRAGISISFVSFLLVLYVSGFDWQPVRIPLNLAKDNTATATFLARSDDRFRVTVQLQHHLPFEQVDTMIRTLLVKEPKSSQGATLPTVTCSVEEDGHAIPFGGYTGSSYGRESIGATLGTFRGRAGHAYAIRADIQGGDPRWQATDPHLAVTVWRDPVFFGLNNLMTTGALAGIAMWIGLLILVVGLIRARKRRAREDAA